MSTASRALVVSQSDSAGGAERYLQRLYDGLAVHEVEAQLLGGVPGWLKDPIPGVGLGPKWSRRTLVAGLARVRQERDRVDRTAAAMRPNWVHVQFKREQIGFTRALAKTAPVVWTEHGVFPRSMSVLSSAYRRASAAASRIICVSDAVAESIEPLVGGHKRLVVIENAVDTRRHTVVTPGRRASSRSRWRISSDARVIVWVGRLDAAKRPMAALDYAQHQPDDVILVVGSGTESAALEARAASLPNVHLVGHLDDVAGAYDAADVLMFTSTGKGEGMPTTIVEASAHGLPTVAHIGSGGEEFARAADGQVVDDWASAEQWRQAFARALMTPASDKRARWVAAHSHDVWLERHLEVFQQVRRP